MYHCWLWSYAVYWLPVLYVMMVFDNNWTIHTSISQNVTCLKFYSLVILMQHINYKYGKDHLGVKILVNVMTSKILCTWNFIIFILLFTHQLRATGLADMEKIPEK